MYQIKIVVAIMIGTFVQITPLISTNFLKKVTSVLYEKMKIMLLYLSYDVISDSTIKSKILSTQFI